MHFYFVGFVASIGLFMTIGAQNIHIIKYGIKQDRWKLVVLICFLCDMLNISLGVFGVGDFLATNKIFANIITILGILFLIVYGTKSFLEMKVKKTINIIGVKSSIKVVMLGSLAVSLLNPHVYIDTILILGGMSTTMPHEAKWFFWFGVVSSSFIWMAFIGKLASKISPLMKRPITWKILEFISGLIMYIIAVYLILSFFS